MKIHNDNNYLADTGSSPFKVKQSRGSYFPGLMDSEIESITNQSVSITNQSVTSCSRYVVMLLEN